MGPAESARGIQLVPSARHPGHVPRDARTRTRPGAERRGGFRFGRVHFPRAERHDRFSGSQKAWRGRWPSRGRRRVSVSVRADPAFRRLLSRRHLQPRRSFATGLPRGPRNGRPPLNTGVPGSPRTSRHGRTGATVRPDRVRRSELAYRGVCHRLGGSGSVAKRPATHPARLETRTKESNMCASQGARRNPEAQ